MIGGLITGPVAQRITRLTTDQKIPGSNPGRVEIIFLIIKTLKIENNIKII